MARSGLILKFALLLEVDYLAEAGLAVFLPPLAPVVTLPPAGALEVFPAPNLVTTVDVGLFISTMGYCLPPSSFLRFLFFRGGLPSDRQTESSSSEISSMMSEVSAASLLVFPLFNLGFGALRTALLVQLLSSE